MAPSLLTLATPENVTAHVKEFDLGIQSQGLRKLSDVEIPAYFYNRKPFSIPVLNTLINGDGLMKSQVISFSAPRGVGKTTLLMSALQSLIDANKGMRCAYLSNEECVEQLAFTATRIGATGIMADNVNDIDEIAELMKSLDVVVIDSFPGLQSKNHQGPRAIEQYAINTLMRAAKATGCSLFCVMHYTKDGKEAGSKNLYHAVDTCISMYKMDEEDNNENCRTIEVTKNRLGSSAEIVLRMTATGFDFTNPVHNKADAKGAAKGGARAVTRKKDIKAILDVIQLKNTIGGARIQDFGDLGIDMGRIERLMRELESGGSIDVSGGGKGTPKENKRWHIGIINANDLADDEDEDDDEEVAG